MFQLPGSQSTNVGWAPMWTTGLAVATNVSVGTRTSSPGPTPTASRARCSAAVPLDRAAAWRVPVTAASSRSNASTSGPTGAIQPLVERGEQRLALGGADVGG